MKSFFHFITAHLLFLSQAKPSAHDQSYDRSASVFSPKGNIYQVNYARMAVGKSMTSVGVKCKDGIVFCGSKRKLKLKDPKFIEKIGKIDDHVVCVSSGLSADCNQLLRECRHRALEHHLQFQEHIPIQTFIQSLSDILQVYTQVGGVRPFGVSFIFGSYIKAKGFEMIQTDPSGVYGSFNVAVIGRDAEKVLSDMNSAFVEGKLDSVESALIE
eukprot:CAMPEP_0171482832 /NCGR_PEP_ID=MMETSP0946-20130122/7754_1 /TAXON_ID=109269 /ORGANISM="Vaucheria litorea, Strain CCMP2940" /LENGTH=213 /DNA_ID=CAMNT_0012015027 /DNA_START=32 /DNA_END=670 /DNA_ORIENTATION=+